MQMPITPDERMKRALNAADRAFWATIHTEYHEVRNGLPYMTDPGVQLRKLDADESAVKNWLLNHAQEYWAGIHGAEPPFGKPTFPGSSIKVRPTVTPMTVPEATTTPESPLAQLGTPGHSHVSWLERNYATARDSRLVRIGFLCLVALGLVGWLWYYFATR